MTFSRLREPPERAWGSICDVPGLRVGHATDESGVTGCTVVLCEGGAVGGVDVRGATPGTREADLLRPECTVERVHAVLLTGGSAYGLDAASGVMQYLERCGVGFRVRQVVVPIVVGAVLFDLGIGDPRARPNGQMGMLACEAAAEDSPVQGSVGAGTGATVGKLRGPDLATKGGIGTASLRLPDGTIVGALVAVNAAGDVVEQSGRRTVAGARGPNGWLRWDPYGTANANPSEQPDDRATGPIPGANTTIGVVATNAPLDKAGATRLAGAAHDGLALAVRPAHTALDGDTFFALSTAPDGRRLWPLPPILTWAATEVTMRAILQAVQNADGRGGVPGWPNLPFAR